MKILMLRLYMAPMGFWVLIVGFLINTISAKGLNGRMYDWQPESEGLAELGLWIGIFGASWIAAFFINVIINWLKK